MAYAGCVGLGNLAFGPLVDAIGVRPVLLAGAAVALPLWLYADVSPAAVGADAIPQPIALAADLEAPSAQSSAATGTYPLAPGSNLRRRA